LKPWVITSYMYSSNFNFYLSVYWTVIPKEQQLIAKLSTNLSGYVVNWLIYYFVCCYIAGWCWYTNRVISGGHCMLQRKGRSSIVGASIRSADITQWTIETISFCSHKTVPAGCQHTLTATSWWASSEWQLPVMTPICTELLDSVNLLFSKFLWLSFILHLWYLLSFVLGWNYDQHKHVHFAHEFEGELIIHFILAASAFRLLSTNCERIVKVGQLCYEYCTNECTTSLACHTCESWYIYCQLLVASRAHCANVVHDLSLAELTQCSK